MNVSHEVGAVWRIIDQGTPTLRLIGEQLSKVDAIAKRVQERLAAIGGLKFAGIVESLSTVGAAAEGAQLKLAGMSETRFTGVNRGLTGVSARLERIEQQAAVAAKALGTLPALPALGGVGARPSAGGGERGHNARNALGHRGKEGPGVEMGIVGFIGAEAVGHGVADILKHGMELQHVQEQMLQGGMKIQEIADATSAAWKEAGKNGLNVVKVMEDIKELRFPFGSTEHAIEFIDPLEKMRVVLNSVSEGKGNESADAVYKMARTGELKGLVEPKDFLSYFDNMTKVISATGGKVGPNDFTQFAKYSKLATFGFDEEFFTKYAPTLIQTMGPSTAGTSLMSLYAGLAGGSVTKRSFGQMQDLGLVGDESKVSWDHGKPQLSPGWMKGTDEFTKNPFAWVKDVLAPLLEQKFGNLTDPTNKESVIAGLSGLFGNRNSAAVIAELALRMKSFDKDAGLTSEAKGIGGSARILEKDPNAAIARLQASWANFLTSIGTSTVQDAVNALNLISNGINGLTDIANKHPDAMKNVVGALGGFAVGLGALAVIGLAAFLPGGLFVVGMTTLAGALAGVAAVNWEAVASKMGLFKDWVVGVPAAITGLFDAIMNAVKSGIDKIKSVLGVGDGLPGMKGEDGNALRRNDEMPAPASKGLFDKIKGVLGISFVTGDNDNSPLSDAVYGGFMRAFREIQGGGTGGDSGGGSGIINASYETGTGGGGVFGGGGSGGSGGSRRHRGGLGYNDTSGGVFGAISGSLASRGDAAMAHLTSQGISREAAAAIVGNAQQESSIRGDGPSGDHGTAHGMFQWRFERFAALKAFAAAHGKPWTDSTTQLDFMVSEAKQRGGAGWLYGKDVRAANEGMRRFERYGDDSFGTRLGNAMGWMKRQAPAVAGRPEKDRQPPMVGPPPSRSKEDKHRFEIKLDGRQIEAVVTKHQARRNEFARAIGGPDGWGHHHPAGSPMIDAA